MGNEMSYLIYNKNTARVVCGYTNSGYMHKTESAAKSALTRLVNKGRLVREQYAIAEYSDYCNNIEKNRNSYQFNDW